LLAAFALMLPLASPLRRMPGRHLAWGAGAGVLLVLATVAITLVFDKGAYLALAASAVVTAGLLWRTLRSASGPDGAAGLASPWLLAAFAALVASVPMVAWHWGGDAALAPGVAVGALLLLAVPLLRALPKAPWPGAWRWQGGLVAGLAAASILVGAVSGGAYLGERFATSEADTSTRVDHWRRALQWLDRPSDWWLGKGLGRYVAQRFNSGRAQDQTGDYRWQSDGQRGWLLLTGGKHELGWGEMLRVSQRIAPPMGPVQVTLDVRAEQATALHFEVCEKHLLYNGECAVVEVGVKAEPGRWQPLRAALKGATPTRGSWYAPNLIVFSVAVATPGGRVEIDKLALQSAIEPALLSNGDFSEGMSHWYVSSDRYHLPWHAKNLWVHVLFEQGLLGVLLLGSLLMLALWRVVLGRARGDVLAAPLAGAIVGAVVVGLVDSVMDMPRISFMLYWLMAMALVLGHDHLSSTTRSHG